MKWNFVVMQCNMLRRAGQGGVGQGGAGRGGPHEKKRAVFD